eukprot:scaffold6539_cov66-Phaeocystis_antarctica.AAC.2
MSRGSSTGTAAAQAQHSATETRTRGGVPGRANHTATAQLAMRRAAKSRPTMAMVGRSQSLSGARAKWPESTRRRRFQVLRGGRHDRTIWVRFADSSDADLREELPAAACLHGDAGGPRGHAGHGGGRGERLHSDGGEHDTKATKEIWARQLSSSGSEDNGPPVVNAFPPPPRALPRGPAPATCIHALVLVPNWDTARCACGENGSRVGPGGTHGCRGGGGSLLLRQRGRPAALGHEPLRADAWQLRRAVILSPHRTTRPGHPLHRSLPRAQRSLAVAATLRATRRRAPAAGRPSVLSAHSAARVGRARRAAIPCLVPGSRAPGRRACAVACPGVRSSRRSRRTRRRAASTPAPGRRDRPQWWPRRCPPSPRQGPRGPGRASLARRYRAAPPPASPPAASAPPEAPPAGRAAGSHCGSIPQRQARHR